MQTADIIRLASTAIAVAALVATIWTPPETDTALLGLAATIVAAVWVRRPGDVAP